MNIKNKPAKEKNLLEEYAGLAMQSIVASGGYVSLKEMGEDSVLCAKALITELEKLEGE